MKTLIRLSALSGLLLALALTLAACGPSSTVRLLYRPADASLIPSPTAPAISVVQFKDARSNSYVGVRKDNSPFIPNGQVPEWVSRSLADELNRQGLRVTYATSLELARAAQPEYILTGELQELWIRESSSTDIAANIKALISVTSHRGKLFNEHMTSSQSRQGLPSSSNAEELLFNTVQELVQAAALKTQQAIAAQR